MTTNSTPLYPIKCKLKSGESETVVDILTVSHSGLMVDSLNSPLVVNKLFTAHFTFPFTDSETEVTVVVFRTYAEINDKPGAPRKTRHMNELVYKKPSKEYNELMVKFLANATHHKS